jgi:cyclophilin family peptidyl-prolyl cis-trans isomerase
MARRLEPGAVGWRAEVLMVRFVLLAAVVWVLCGCVQAGRDYGRDAGAVYVRMETTAGAITLELDAARAPVSVENFLGYVSRGAYDGTIFHRTIPGFVIQGGGYDRDLIERAKEDEKSGRPDKPISNEWTNGLRNVRGTIAMAREADPDTATREFYINVADNPKLDTPREQTGKAGYAVFGRIIAGMGVVDAIVARPTRAIPERDMKDVPVEPVVVTRVSVIGREQARAAAASEKPAAAPPRPEAGR